MYSSNINQFLRLLTLNSTFYNLKSLVLIGLKPGILFPSQLIISTSLPNLCSLILYVSFDLEHFNDMYRLIFSFPQLKYSKLSSETYQPIMPLSIATDKQYSSIEYLNIDHSCSLKDLLVILSFTPQLKSLVCKEFIQSNVNHIVEVPFQLMNLIYLRINECYLVFDELEMFITKVSSQLEALTITSYWDSMYLDADRWQQMIMEHIPHLKELSLQHHEYIDDDFQITNYHTAINQFTSWFWYTRGLIFDVTIDVNDWSWYEIIYSIHRFEQKWYELPEISRITTTEQIHNIELRVTGSLYRQANEIFTDQTKTLFRLICITRLDISQNEIASDILINLICCLPNLDALRLQSLSVVKSSSESNKNKITKVNIQSVTELAHIQFLIELCPCMQYFEIGYSTDIDIKSIIKLVFMKETYVIYSTDKKLCVYKK
ncbi:hypothetical protein I4U23_020148 [Adineta vaga]|nr:hypothetical protein I4U23_020148 [Adineta vaga]